jgi:hypothetical protein
MNKGTRVNERAPGSRQELKFIVGGACTPEADEKRFK